MFSEPTVYLIDAAGPHGQGPSQAAHATPGGLRGCVFGPRLEVPARLGWGEGSVRHMDSTIGGGLNLEAKGGMQAGQTAYLEDRASQMFRR